MRVKVGCEFALTTTGPTPSVWQVRPRPSVALELGSPAWATTPALACSQFVDSFGNLCDRVFLPAGQSVLRFSAIAEVLPEPDAADEAAPQVPVEVLPDDTLRYLLASRFCVSDQLHDQAWELFGATAPGWSRVQAVCDWVHQHVHFDYQATSPLTTAADVWKSRTGVCRDFAHLAVTFCRSLNIPARYAVGYLPDIGVPPPDDPMDFCAWMEVYLGGRWWTFDPRNNQRRVGRVLIGHGRDAVDVAMLTTYGMVTLDQMTVWAGEA